MNVHIIFLIFGYFLSNTSSLPANDASSKSSNPKDSSIQSKRDLSLSYAATEIGSKDGSRAKTITVIKNLAGKKDEPLKIDPKLHKSENWASDFRDNFDSYGIIPDVPDIDELFAFVNKKKEDKKPPKEKDNPEAKESKGKDKKPNKGKEEPPKETKKEEVTTPSPAVAVEEVTEEVVKDEKVEKIAGDAELLMPPGKQGKVKSQSLDMGRYSVREPLSDDNYAQSLTKQQFSQNAKHNDKYIQLPAVPYNYPEPSLKGYIPPNGGNSAQAQSNRASIIVTTPSGKSFDVPVDNTTSNPPYLAPNFRRNQGPQQFPTSSQPPYVAPNLRKPYEVQLNNTSPAAPPDCGPPPNVVNNNRQPITFNGYRNVVPSIRTDVFRGYRPRSRGLRFY